MDEKKVEIFILIGKIIIIAIVAYIAYLIFTAYVDIPGLEPYREQVGKFLNLI